MMKKIGLLTVMIITNITIHAGILGTWKGKLTIGSTQLPLVFHISKDACTLDSPAQGVKDIPCKIDFLSEDSVSIQQFQLMIHYTGKLKDNSILGTFTQAGNHFDLILERGEVTYNRPQTPQPPFPYQTKEIIMESNGVRFAGTLTFPVNYQANNPTPIVLLLTGSGPQNRDEELFSGHRSFAVIADYLAKHGVASLRFDDRGVGGTTGKSDSVTTQTLMQDAKAQIAWIRKNGKWSRVGVIGHSEGGTIGYMLGAQKVVDFIISLSGTAVRGDSLMVKQLIQISKATSDQTLSREQAEKQISVMPTNPWLSWFLQYNPQEAIRKIVCPVLSLYGEKDLQVDWQQNKTAFDHNIPQQTKSQSKVYPNLNHLFQHCKTGSPLEYSEIEETISTEVLNDIYHWIMQQTSNR